MELCLYELMYTTYHCHESYCAVPRFITWIPSCCSQIHSSCLLAEFIQGRDSGPFHYVWGRRVRLDILDISLLSACTKRCVKLCKIVYLYMNHTTQLCGSYSTQLYTTDLQWCDTKIVRKLFDLISRSDKYTDIEMKMGRITRDMIIIVHNIQSEEYI